MADNNSSASGGCLCGAVRYKITGPLRNVVVCHCSMCQKLHGGSGAHSKALKADIQITNDKGLVWFRSSEIAQRGFCRECGSSLFWQPFKQDATGILAGSLDDTSGLKTIGHIFVSEKAHFEALTDDLPKFSESSDGELEGDFK